MRGQKEGNGTCIGDDAVNVRVGIAIAVLASGKLAEVTRGERADVVEEPKDDTAGGDAVYFEVELEKGGR